MTKIKDKENIKSNKGKAKSYMWGKAGKADSWLSAETLQPRREWCNVFTYYTLSMLFTVGFLEPS